MGPISLFDKSFLQAISVDEAVWFDHLFLPVVCPIFYVDPVRDAELVKRFKEFGNQPTLDKPSLRDEEDETISVAHTVRRKRGSWYQVPKDMPDPKD
jgi:hypothetical protein